MNVDKYRMNSLFNLIEKGDCRQVKDFFDQYPELINKIATEHDWTPVMYACRYGNLEMLMMLQKIGFTLDRNSTGPSNLLHLSLYSYNVKIVRYLISQLDIGMKDISQLIKFSGFLKKMDIALLLLLNGGYVVYSPSDSNKQDSSEVYCYNVYPVKTQEGDATITKYFHDDEDVTQESMILS